MTDSTLAFEMTDGSVSLGGDPVLRNVTTTVRRGEFLAILGGNGAGKSTLLRAFLGLITLDRGQTKIWGQPAKSFKNWSEIAYVPQQLTAIGAVPVSVREVVASGQFTPGFRTRRLHKRVRSSEERLKNDRPPDQDRVRRALETVGLYHRRSEALETLSGGQQRRVMIARALARESNTVLLDEPTAGVDSANRERLHETLEQLKESGATVLMVTHELAEIADLATRCLVLDSDSKDSVRFDGTPPLPSSLHDPEGHHSHIQGPSSTWEMRL